MLENLDDKCGGQSFDLPQVSYFDGAFSIFLFLLTVTTNLLIILGLYKHSFLLSRNYYLVLGNIAIADLIMGLICDPMSVSFHIKEALGPEKAPMRQIEQSSMHFIFFLTNTVSVLSMALLTVDRLGVILIPFFYYSKLTKTRMMIFLVFTWVIASLTTVNYFYMGYIRFLVVFAFSAVILTLVVMTITMVLLKRRLRQAKALAARRSSHSRSHADSLVTVRHKTEHEIEFTHLDEKITKTFLSMLVLFILNYLPCMVLTIYMNLCISCDCKFVHVLRDIVFLAVLSSALCRALNFVIRLEALQEAIKSIFKHPPNIDGDELPLKVSV